MGNGRLGAMVRGGIREEVLHLNENSVWSGHPYFIEKPEMRENLPRLRELLFNGKYGEAEALAQRTMTIRPDPRYGTYKPLGDLRLEFDLPAGEHSGYRRSLDLDSAVAESTFNLGGVTYTRRVFASAPSQVLVVRLEASRPGSISLSAALTREKEATTVANGPDMLLMSGECDNGGVRFHALLRAIPSGGTVTLTNNKLRITAADSVTLILAAEEFAMGTEEFIAQLGDFRRGALRGDHFGQSTQAAKDLHVQIVLAELNAELLFGQCD